MISTPAIKGPYKEVIFLTPKLIKVKMYRTANCKPISSGQYICDKAARNQSALASRDVIKLPEVLDLSPKLFINCLNSNWLDVESSEAEYIDCHGV